jgi:hypothetical protein
MTPATVISTSERQIEANRANAALSTGPRSDAGKSASSANAVSHGLTARQPVLPNESEEQYRHFIEEHCRKFLAISGHRNSEIEELAAELADLRWRVRRAPAFEVKVLDFEINSLLNNPELTEGLTRNQIEGLAYIRLVERRVLPNLHAQEARLNRHIEKVFTKLLNLLTTPPETSAAAPASPLPPPPAPEIRKNEPISQPAVSSKIGRNEPCPCGSNLKYKRCCGNPAGSPATRLLENPGRPEVAGLHHA